MIGRYVVGVCLGDEPIGLLGHDDGGLLDFDYLPQWREAGQPLSVSMPLTQELDPVRVSNWFRRLLPDPDVCRAMGHYLDISLANDAGLLAALGGDAPGAITMTPGPGYTPGSARAYRPLNEHELHELLILAIQRPLLAGVEDVRLLLAGNGWKLPLFCDGVRLYVPLGCSVSSHVVRFQPDLASGMLENEAFCMQLARAMGLPVVDCRLRDGVDRILLVERFDRRVCDERVVRLHQESFCQALGTAPGRVFEQEGGPSLGDCFALLRRCSIRPAADIKALLDWVIFTALIRASACHAGRLALLLSPRGPRLAPFSGLRTGGPGSTSRAAMGIGGCYDYASLGEAHWRSLATETGIHFRLVRQRLWFYADRILPTSRAVAESFRRQYGECRSVGQIIGTLMSAVGKLDWLN